MHWLYADAYCGRAIDTYVRTIDTFHGKGPVHQERTELLCCIGLLEWIKLRILCKPVDQDRVVAVTCNGVTRFGSVVMASIVTSSHVARR